MISLPPQQEMIEPLTVADLDLPIRRHEEALKRLIGLSLGIPPWYFYPSKEVSFAGLKLRLYFVSDDLIQYEILGVEPFWLLTSKVRKK